MLKKIVFYPYFGNYRIQIWALGKLNSKYYLLSLFYAKKKNYKEGKAIYSTFATSLDDYPIAICFGENYTYLPNVSNLPFTCHRSKPKQS